MYNVNQILLTITIDTQCYPQIVAGIQLGSTLPTIVGLLGNSVDTKTCSVLDVFVIT